MKHLSGQKQKEVLNYILSDYQFLQDYQIAPTDRPSNSSFVATIKNTQQKVRFNKQKYSAQMLPRFKALHNLYKNGIILADNMFILEECQEFYYYVIEAQMDLDDERFHNLHQYLYCTDIGEEESRAVLGKLKILIDCLHQQGQAFAGLDTRRVIIDDQKHLYLAPFDLQLQLRTDNYSRAYYPPQILTKISKGQTQISQQMMHKWDIWSFGCICTELLAYSSPIFLTTSLPKQMKQIQKFSCSNETFSSDESITNIIKNSLNIEPSVRTISTTEVESINFEMKQQQAEEHYRETISSITNMRVQQRKGHCLLKQLNIHNKNEGSCVFTLDMLTLSNVQFQKELHVSIQIGKTFHFYIDYDQKSPQKYVINRKITVKNSFQEFQKWLSQPIAIQLKQDSKKSKIMLNAQSFIIIHEQQRLWTEPIIGSYCSSTISDFPKARLKLKCSLITPQPIDFQELSQRRKLKEKKVELQLEASNKAEKQACKSKPCQTEQPLKELSSNIPQKRKTKSSSPQVIPTISQISQSLSLLNLQLKRKMQIDDTEDKEDPLQKQLSSLLEIQ